MCFSIINAVGGNVKSNVKVKGTTPALRTSPPRRGIKGNGDVKGMAVGGVNTVEIAV